MRENKSRGNARRRREAAPWRAVIQPRDNDTGLGLTQAGMRERQCRRVKRLDQAF
jgi:hypothetical protein